MKIMEVNQEQETKLCQMCQNYGDHKLSKLICAECDERGHAKKHCPYLAESKTSNTI